LCEKPLHTAQAELIFFEVHAV